MSWPFTKGWNSFTFEILGTTISCARQSPIRAWCFSYLNRFVLLIRKSLRFDQIITTIITSIMFVTNHDLFFYFFIYSDLWIDPSLSQMSMRRRWRAGNKNSNHAESSGAISRLFIQNVKCICTVTNTIVTAASASCCLLIVFTKGD